MKRLLLLIALVFLINTAESQYNWEFGGKIGSSNYLGDIGGGDGSAKGWLLDMELLDTKYSVGGFTRYRFSNRWSFGGYLTYLQIAGKDNNSPNPSRRGRNLSFKNDMFELVVRADISILNIYDLGGKGYYNPDFKLYAFAGVGGLYSNPKAKYQGEWHKLRELTTELTTYSPIHFVVPVGMGAFFTFNRKHRFGMEVQYSFAYTDYLDDVSDVYADPEALPNDVSRALANRRGGFVPSNPDDVVPAEENYTAGNKRGNPANNDGYMIVNFYYSHVIKGKSNFYKKGHYNFLHRKNKKRRKSRAKF